MNTASPRVGMFPPPDLLDWDPATARAFLDQVAAAGIDHVCCADHVSFVAGLGFDGLLQATALATLHPSLRISCGLYLLPLTTPGHTRGHMSYRLDHGPLIDHAAKVTTVELLGAEPVEGKNAYKLRLTLKSGDQHSLWIDAATIEAAKERDGFDDGKLFGELGFLQ